MKIGCAQVSTKDQHLELQIDALEKDGCKRIYKEIVSGAKSERPVLQEMLTNLREDDIIVVWKLDRLGRSLKHLVELVSLFTQYKVGLGSLHDHIDTTTSQGRLILNIFASIAEFERDLIQKRTRTGLNAARARGILGGKLKDLSKNVESIACAAETLYKEGKLSIIQIIKQLGISKATFYNYLRSRNVVVGSYSNSKIKLEG